jgi:hypothetical protein
VKCGLKWRRGQAGEGDWRAGGRIGCNVGAKDSRLPLGLVERGEGGK